MITLAQFSKQHGFSPQRARKLASEGRIGAWMDTGIPGQQEFVTALKIGPRAWIVPQGAEVRPPVHLSRIP